MGRPLPTKLGIREGSRVALVRPPRRLRALLDPLPAGVVVREDPSEPGSWDVVLLLTRAVAALEERLEEAIGLLHVDGGLWVGWPKKTSSMASDLDRSEVMRRGLAAGLVDNKVCAVDDDWSALRFVYRLEDRGRSAPGERAARGGGGR